MNKKVSFLIILIMPLCFTVNLAAQTVQGQEKVSRSWRDCPTITPIANGKVEVKSTDGLTVCSKIYENNVMIENSTTSYYSPAKMESKITDYYKDGYRDYSKIFKYYESGKDKEYEYVKFLEKNSDIREYSDITYYDEVNGDVSKTKVTKYHEKTGHYPSEVTIKEYDNFHYEYNGQTMLDHQLVKTTISEYDEDKKDFLLYEYIKEFTDKKPINTSEKYYNYKNIIRSEDVKYTYDANGSAIREQTTVKYRNGKPINKKFKVYSVIEEHEYDYDKAGNEKEVKND